MTAERIQTRKRFTAPFTQERSETDVQKHVALTVVLTSKAWRSVSTQSSPMILYSLFVQPG